MNTDYRLQLLNHAEIFPTREEALEYIEDNFKGEALWGEPALFFYGTEREPKMILAVGASHTPTKPRVCLIDDAELRRLIAEVQEAVDENTEDIAICAERILNIVSATGLTLDENKIKDQITYEPDNRDALICDAQSVAEAIAIISTFVQNKFKEIELTVEDTKSVDLTYETTPQGSTLKADVNISEEGNDDDLDFNNNIVGIKSDGLFASVNIEYDTERNRLIFTTSGIKNGRFVTDANKKIIDFGAHTIYRADNEDHTVNVTIDQERGTISGDVKISTDDDNLLVAKDGKMYVSGRAKDIKYKNTTVGAKLNSIDEAINEILDKIRILGLEDLIEGDESDTILTKAVKKTNGGYTVTADVRLSNDESIKVGDGGIRANIDINVDSNTNKLILKVGNNEKEVTLPGISILDNIYYDSANKCIVITWKDGQQQTVIPVGDMLKTWIVENNQSSPVVLTKAESSVSGQPEVLSADLKIAQTDNLIGKDAYGQIYVRKSEIDNKIAEEANARMAADTALAQNISAEAETRHAEDDLLNDSINAAREEAANNLAAATQQLNNKIDTTKDAIYERIDGDEERINQAYANAEEAKAKVDLTNANLDAEIERATTAESNNSAAIMAEADRAIAAENALGTRVTAVESGLSTEREARATADAVHDEQISNIREAIASSEASHREDIERLSGEINANAEAINIINGSENVPGSIREAVKGAKDEAEQLVGNEEARAVAAEQRLETLIANETARATQGESAAVESAKEYADHAIADAKHLCEDYADNAKREAIESANAYTDNKVSTTNEYADSVVAAEKARAMAAEQANADAISALQAKDIEIEGELANKIEHVEIVKNSQSDLQYILKVDGIDAGEINIPKDQFLQDVSYNASTKELEFIFITTTGANIVKVNINDLVDVYMAGNGLVLNGNVFSVKVNEDSESYLSVTPEGLKISGIDEALATKANVGDSYTKAESDAKYLTEHQDISNLVTRTEFDGVVDNVNANTSAIAIINGNEAQAGSIKNAEANAKAHANTIVGNETSRAQDAENILRNSIAIINGNEAQEGSVKNAIKVSKDYTDNQVAALRNQHNTDIAAINESLDNKANKSEVYTKSEIEAKGYLTNTDIALLATKEELSTESTRAIAAESNLSTGLDTANSNIASNTTDINDLKREALRLNLIVDETNTVKLTKSKDDSGTELSADVKLDATGTNIIKITGNGITADVEMAYSQTTNTITFSNGLTTQEFQLAGASLIEDGFYDSTTRQIVLITRLSDGTTKEIRINADALIHTLKVENGTNNPIKLAKTTDSEGVDVLSARLDISTESHNLILNNNGTLYASNEAKNLTGLWGGEEKSLQWIVSQIEGASGSIDDIEGDVIDLKNDMAEAKRDITSLQSELSTVSNRVNQNTIDIATNRGSIETLTTQVSDLNSRVTNLTNDFEDLTETVQGYEQRVTTLETDMTNVKSNVSTLITEVNTLKEQLGDISGLKTVAERLATIEDIVNNLIDFDTY